MFFIQPIVGKIVLPKFGGEAWTTSFNAFAIVSCVGLLCAWLLSSFRKKRWAISVITSGFVLLLTYFSTDYRSQWQSLHSYLAPFCVAMCLLFILQVILPFWFGQAATPAWVDPYFVMAFAHLGAMTSLISYPLCVEPYLPLNYQYTIWVIGFAVIGLLFLLCTWILGVSSCLNSGASASQPEDRPTWLRRFRWSVLGGIPTVLLAYGPLSPDPRASLHLVVIFELTLVVAYVRLPRGKPSLLSWGVQILGMMTCLPSLMMVSGTLFGPEEKLIYMPLLVGVLVLALVPHRWTLLMQGVTCLTVVALHAANAVIPVTLIYIVHLTVVAVTSWGCYGETVADCPGPDRFAEFLFFTGLAPSVVFAFVPVVIQLVTPQVAYPGIVLIAFLARYLPGKHAPRNNGLDERDWSDRMTDKNQPIVDTSIRVAE
jgi:hypothetical protein